MIDIFTHKRWCNHCKDHVDLTKHHETCEFARLKYRQQFTDEEIIDLARKAGFVVWSNNRIDWGYGNDYYENLKKFAELVRNL